MAEGEVALLLFEAAVNISPPALADIPKERGRPLKTFILCGAL